MTARELERHLAAMQVAVSRLSAWADLLDDINVFPVADGDTGRNLVLSLVPLRCPGDAVDVGKALLTAARGNSGNIMGRFLSALLGGIRAGGLEAAVRAGRTAAIAAVTEPQPGTMLTVLDTLVDTWRDGATGSAAVVDRLVETVRSTTTRLPELARAGVVDAGALGLLIFLDAYLKSLEEPAPPLLSVVDSFPGQLTVAEAYCPDTIHECCVDAVLRVDGSDSALADSLAPLGDSVVTYREGSLVKVHLHGVAASEIRSALGKLGTIEQFHADDIADQTEGFINRGRATRVHLMTDAAGSLTREQARALNVTLLNSYVTIGAQSFPETHLDPCELYRAMVSGVRVSTSQASVLERHESYLRVCGSYAEVIYLSVGSTYTGNVACARAWQAEHDPQGRFLVIDSGTASGSLGLLVYAAAQWISAEKTLADVCAFIEAARERVVELVFLDRLDFLARGGRLSKTRAFFGDLVGVKPVIRPMADGARKVGVARNRGGQVDMAREALRSRLTAKSQGWLWLEYTDNREWLEDELLPEFRRAYPSMMVALQPMSLTSGAHMGPGTWAIAFLDA